MKSLKLFTILQKYVGAMNSLANQLRNEQIDTEPARVAALEKIEGLRLQLGCPPNNEK